jgi:hypothetical protein
MEFVLQKYGENSGRAISSNRLEIPSGNYRLFGRCPAPALDIEVRVDHDSPTICSRQTNYHRSDDRGFIEILPYTDLAAGTWQIRCYGDLMEELTGRGWQASLLVTVFPIEIDPLARLEELITNEIEPFLPREAPREVIELQFVDLETNSSFVFDFSLPEEKNTVRERPIELPDPATMTKTLQLSSPASSLPPKLSSSKPHRQAPRLPTLPR